MCIFHYFNYYLPDFVIAISLRFMFGFSFWILVLISLNAIFGINIPFLESLFLTKDQALAFGVGALTPRP